MLRAVRVLGVGPSSQGDSVSLIYQTFTKAYSGSDTTFSVRDRIVKIKPVSAWGTLSSSREHLGWRCTTLCSPGSANRCRIMADLWVYYGSFLAKDSKDLEERMRFRIHTGIPSVLPATWVAARCTDDYGRIG